MLADLFVAFPEIQASLRAGSRWLSALFPAAAFGDAGLAAQKAAITDTRVAQPALGMVELALARLLERFGVAPAVVGGHSYGELVALAVAGALEPEGLPALSVARANAILAASGTDPGTMAAVGASAGAVRAACAGGPGVSPTGPGLEGVSIANLNAPDQTVIAGLEPAIVRAVEVLGKAGIPVRRIPVACAFHSPIVEGASATFAEILAGVPMAAPRVPVFANATASVYPSDPEAARALLAQQLRLPVRFADQIEAMHAAGARVFVEVGPGGVLTDLVGRILKGREYVAIRCDAQSASVPGQGIVGFLAALAQLAVTGADVRADALFGGRAVEAFDLAEPPAKGPSKSSWIVNGHSARPLEGDLPEFALRIPAAPVSSVTASNPPASHEREAAITDYLRSMRELAEGQRQVMLRFLGDAAVHPSAGDTVGARAQSFAPPPPSERPTLPSLPSAPPRKSTRMTRPAPPPPSADLTPLQALIATVSERTGYPPDMLDPDLDLEADLGVDSIKRIEILGQLRDRLGLGASSDAGRSDALEELARIKTLRKIAEWLEARASSMSSPPAAPPSVSPPPASTVRLAPMLRRYVLEATPVPAAVANCVRVDGRRFVIVPDRGGVAARLAELLSARGARVHILAPGEDPAFLGGLPQAPGEVVDGVVHLESLGAESHAPVRSLFALAQAAVRAKALWVVAATGRGGKFGVGEACSQGPGGIGGMLKSVAKEHPQLRVRAIDLDPAEDAAQLAANIYAELLADDKRVEVGYAGGVRHALSAVASDLRDEGPRLELGSDSVVLMTGGARGITAEVAVELARRFRCRLVLVGRSALGEEEDSELARAKDGSAVRRLLVERANGAGPVSLGAIEGACRSVLAAREVRATLARIAGAGGRGDYHAVDVRDAAAFGAFIDSVYARCGRIDGVVHGAGVIDDKLLGDKTRESFDRVFDTKVASALTLGEKLRPDVQFVAFFSSVSGAFGNRGQVDYAAANDALDKLARDLERRLPARILSVNWGPWGGVGMVSAELAREYEKRGVDTISPLSGARGFVEELCAGSEPQVILAANLAGFA
jgi:acyl transferase domain-containing protein/NAD(P)-dependent dehydrogenase (short-subunit alcohol dehydrogenase family)